MNWTQPICAECYEERFPGRHPVIVRNADGEKCCDCEKVSYAGIYFRVDPRTVKFPREDK